MKEVSKSEFAGLLTLERPLFAKVVRRLFGVSNREVAACLEEQRRTGGRLGQLLHSQGHLTRDQIVQVHRYQARWVANSLRADLDCDLPNDKHCFSLCMPAYNEAENIEDTLDAACAILPEFFREFEVIVVDDGSSDGTGDIVARYGEFNSHVRVVRHPQNKGYGGAITSCLKAAQGDLIAFIDSDGQFSLLDLPQLLLPLNDSDVVIGYRYNRADSGIRLFNAWGWNWLIRMLLGVNVRDLDCAFKLFRKSVVDQLRLTSQGPCINAEIMTQCIHGGLKISQCPVNHYPRYHGAPTGAALRVIYKAFRELPSLWKLRGQANPFLQPNSPTVTASAPSPLLVRTSTPHPHNGVHAPLLKEGSSGYDSVRLRAVISAKDA